MSFIYQRYSDNVAPNATVTASAEDTTYPVANIIDRNPGKPAKLTTTTGWWKFAFAGAQRVDLVSLIHHNLSAGLSVKIQADVDDASWGAPTINAAITIPALPVDGYPLCPWLDLTGVAGYSSGGFQYWRLEIIGTNTDEVAIGEMWLGSEIRTLSFLLASDQQMDARPVIEHRTDYQIPHIYDLGVRVRRIIGDLLLTPSTAWDDYVAWVRDCRGHARASLVVPESAVNDALLVRHIESEMGLTRVDPNISTVSIQLEEVARGLVL